jgi:hypothetical protein
MKKQCRLFFPSFLLVATMMFNLSVTAETIYVKPASAGGDDDAGDGLSWETAYATPVKAFSLAEQDDIIALLQGTYTMPSGEIDNAAKSTNVQIQGGYTGNGEDRIIDPANTIFEYAGTGAGRVLSTNYGTGLKFSGITFQNLKPAASGYGIFCQMAAGELILEDCVIKAFENVNGANIRAIIRLGQSGASTLTINRCQFINCKENSTATGNAIIARNAGSPTIRISNSIIKGSTRAFLNGSSSTVTIANCTFIDNPQGAAINLTANANIYNSIFYNSTLAGSGTLNNSYYNGSIGSLTSANSVSFSDATTVFADLTNFYPATAFAGIDAGDNTAAAGATDIAGNTRIVNNTVDIGAYENIPAPGAIAGANVSSVETSALAGYYPYGSTVQIPVTVNAGCVPDPIDGVIFTGTAPSYTANVTVKSPRTITFTATAANYEVTINADNVTVISPTLVNNKYASAASSTILFEVNEGCENPTVTVGGVPYSLDQPVGGVYTVALTGLTGTTTVAITATIKQFDVTLGTSDGIDGTPSLTNVTNDKANYGSDVIVSFTIASDKNYPYATVNGVYQALTENSGTYSFTIANVTEAQTVNLTGYYFAENVLPVTEDTYYRYNSNISGYYASSDIMESRGSGGYACTPLLKFVPTDAQKAAGYNKVSLKLVPQEIANSSGYTYKIGQVPATYATINDVPSNVNVNAGNLGAWTQVGTESGSIVAVVNTPVSLDVTDNYVLDMPDEIRLAVFRSAGNNIFKFHSLENGNPEYIPVLIFEKVQSTGINGAGVDDDPVTGVKYYDLTGKEIVNPSEKGVYIISKTHQSGKKTVAKAVR